VVGELVWGKLVRLANLHWASLIGELALGERSWDQMELQKTDFIGRLQAKLQ